MYRTSLITMLGVALAGTAANADTMHFQNATASRVNGTIAEQVNNEKDVDFGDFDNDGDLDVAIGNAFSDFGTRRNKLYQNDGGVFNEVSGAPVISGFSALDVSRKVFMRDFNDDGWLDLYIINDANSGIGSGTDKIYINQHPGDVFQGYVDETASRLVFGSQSGCSGTGCTGAACTGASWDINGDGYIDVYCGNYPNSNQDRIYLNLGAANPGFFTEMTSTMVPFDQDYTVESNTADLNGDGKLDLLISNDLDANKIYYNDNLDAGSGLGDFNYANSVQSLGFASAGENAMHGGDFDNDGDQDIYWTNHTSSTGDRILMNAGNDGSNKATFVNLNVLPESVTTMASRKATIADLNDDGRVDVVVGKDVSFGNSRPTVLRNTSVGGQISFVDWTPAGAFPADQTHRGWNVAIFDTNGDGDLDIFLGGWAGEHIFEQVPPQQLDEGDLNGGVIGSLFNHGAAAVTGSVLQGESDDFVIENMTPAAFVSLVLTGPGDYSIELYNGATLLQTIDRGGVGVEEAVYYNPASMPATLTVRVNGLACGHPLDIDGNCSIGTGDLLQLLAAWNQFGTQDLLDLLAQWGDYSESYVLEALARDG